MLTKTTKTERKHLSKITTYGGKKTIKSTRKIRENTGTVKQEKVSLAKKHSANLKGCFGH